MLVAYKLSDDKWLIFGNILVAFFCTFSKVSISDLLYGVHSPHTITIVQM